MAKIKKEEEVQGTQSTNSQVKKPPYAPVGDLVGQNKGEIFGVKINEIDPKDIARLEKGLMTENVYDLTLSTGTPKEGKIHFARNIATPEVKAYFTLKSEKPFIPLKTADGHQFTMEQQEILRSGKNILYNVESRSGKALLKVAKLDLQKGGQDNNYTNQLIVKDITNLPIEKFSFVEQKMDTEQIRDFLNGTGAKIENPILKGKEFKGVLTQYFDPIKGTSNFRADAKLKESFALNKALKTNEKQDDNVAAKKSNIKIS